MLKMCNGRFFPLHIFFNEEINENKFYNNNISFIPGVIIRAKPGTDNTAEEDQRHPS